MSTSQRKIKLSTVEELIMTVLVGQSKELYGMEISDAIERTAGEYAVAFGSLYPALRRLEDKGFVVSRWGDESEERAGARRRYYSVTAEGKEALKTIRDIRDALACMKIAVA